MPSVALIDYMWAATRERFGFVLTTDNADRLRQLLYAVRRSHMSDFVNLSLTVADGKVWILNKEGINDAPQERESEASQYPLE